MIYSRRNNLETSGLIIVQIIDRLKSISRSKLLRREGPIVAFHPLPPFSIYSSSNSKKVASIEINFQIIILHYNYSPLPNYINLSIKSIVNFLQQQK